jgi:hypothetical protein
MNRKLHLTIAIVLWLLGTSTFSFGQPKMLWGESSGKLLQANTDGSNRVLIQAQHIPYDLQADTVNQTIFWTETVTKSIWKYHIALDSTEKIFQTDESIKGLTIYQGHLYFALASGIKKMNLNGSQVEHILTVTDASDVLVVNNELYWSDPVADKIWKQNTGGGAHTTLFSNLNNPNNLIYNPADMKIYWREYCGTDLCSGIRRSDISGGTVQKILNDFVEGFTLDHFTNKLIGTSGIFDEIFSINTNGTGMISLFDITSNPRSITRVGDSYYWIDLSYRDYLYRSDLTGNIQQPIASSPVYNPQRFAVDTSAGWIYWVNAAGPFFDDKSESIFRSRLDGNDVQLIIPGDDLTNPFGIAIDVLNNKLYYTQEGNSLYRSNLDGTSIETLLPNDGTFSYYVPDIAIDVPNSRIFMTDPSGKIKKFSLIDNQISILAEGVGAPSSIMYEPTGDMLYFSEFGGGKTIQSMPASGGERDTIMTLTDVFSRVKGIWADPSAGVLYWIDSGKGKINTVSLDGTNNTTLVTVPGNISLSTGIQVFPASVIVNTAEALNNRTHVYPNPFSNYILVSNISEGDHLLLYNIMGALVKSQLAGANEMLQMEAAELPKGLYLLVVLHKNGAKNTHKLVKTR